MDFIVKNYIIIIIVAAFLIFALIGFAVDNMKNRRNKEDKELLTRPNDDVDINLIREEPIVEEPKEDNITESVIEPPLIEEENNENMDN